MSPGTAEATGLGELVGAGLLAASFSVKLGLRQMMLYRALWVGERSISVQPKSAF